jgi:hypothetical protein
LFFVKCKKAILSIFFKNFFAPCAPPPGRFAALDGGLKPSALPDPLRARPILAYAQRRCQMIEKSFGYMSMK